MKSYFRTSIFLFTILTPRLLLSQVFGVWTLLSYDTDTVYTVKICQRCPHILAQWHANSVDSIATSDCRYVIDLRLASDHSIFQTIIDTAGYVGSPSIEFVDIDQDGYLDLKLIAHTFASGEESYHFWTFHKKQNRFIYDPEFSQLQSGLAIDSIQRTIIQTARLSNSPPCEDRITYKIINHRLRAIEHVWEQATVAYGEPKVRTFIEKLVKGKLKLVKVIEPD